MPGDDIIAHISSGKGLTIHNVCCRNVQDHLTDQRHYLPVSWEIAKDRAIEFETEICIDILNQQGVLADITRTVAKQRSNILSIQSEARAGGVYQVCIRVSIIDLAHLNTLLRKLSAINGVVNVVRK